MFVIKVYFTTGDSLKDILIVLDTLLLDRIQEVWSGAEFVYGLDALGDEFFRLFRPNAIYFGESDFGFVLVFLQCSYFSGV